MHKLLTLRKCFTPLAFFFTLLRLCVACNTKSFAAVILVFTSACNVKSFAIAIPVFLQLRVAQKALQLIFQFFFSFSFSSSRFLSNFGQLLLQIYVIKIESPSLVTSTNYCTFVWKFCLCEHGMSCTLELNSNSGYKRGHVESCHSTTKNINIFTMTMPLTTEPVRVVTYPEGL